MTKYLTKLSVVVELETTVEAENYEEALIQARDTKANQLMQANKGVTIDHARVSQVIEIKVS